jgi:sucrose-6-phosphate hydrolase SacC (GH32 family)
MNNWGYARDTPTVGWRGAMTVPRALGLIDTADGIRLTQQPVAELDAHRVPLVDFVALKVAGDSNPLAAVHGSALDVVAAIDLQRSTAKQLRLAVRVGPGESTEIVLDLANPSLSVDRVRSGRHLIHRSYAGPRRAALDLADVILDLRVLVDTTSVEVFAGGGIVAITEQIFPSPSSTGLVLEAVDGTVFFESFRVYEIETPG